MIRNPKALGLLMVALVVVGEGRFAAAAPAEAESERHIKAGIELRRRGDDQAALDEFEAAYRAEGTARAAGQLALCEQALGNWAPAQEHMLVALARPDDPWVAKNRSALDAALAVIRKHTARLEVTGSPDGATLSVAGRSIGRLPMARPALVNAGTVDLEVAAPGHRPVQRTLQLVPEGYLRVLVRLEPLAQGEPPRASRTADPDLKPAREPEAGTVVAPAGATLGAGAAEPSSSRPLYGRPVFWVVLGAVVAGGAVAALLLLRGTEYPSGPSRTLGP